MPVAFDVKTLRCEACKGTGKSGPWNPSPTWTRCQWCKGLRFVRVLVPHEKGERQPST